MSNSENPPLANPEAQPKDHSDLSNRVQTLRSALLMVIAAILLLTGTFFIFLFREVILIRRQSDELSRIVLDYQKTAVPQLQEFKGKLHDFAKTNPNFAPVYSKYFGTNAPEPTLPTTRATVALPTTPPSTHSQATGLFSAGQLGHDRIHVVDAASPGAAAEGLKGCPESGVVG